MPNVFICYRRDDSIDTAGRIYSWLKIRLPEGEVFFDVNTIQAGSNFRSAIEDALSKGVEVVLVIIGKTWVESPAENGGVRRRLEEDDDHVRREIEIALALNKILVPVLVQGATMPKRQDLPPSIAVLADINAIPVRPDPDFDNDMRRLREAIHAHRPSVPFQAPQIASSPMPFGPPPGYGPPVIYPQSPGDALPTDYAPPTDYDPDYPQSPDYPPPLVNEPSPADAPPSRRGLRAFIRRLVGR